MNPLSRRRLFALGAAAAVAPVIPVAAPTAGFGAAVLKEEGSRQFYDPAQARRYSGSAYGSRYIVSREDLEDNLYERVSKRRRSALA